MTLEEAMAILRAIGCELGDQINSTYCRKRYNAMKIAIKTLEQELCDDAISRKSVLDVIKKWSFGGWVEVPEEEWNEFILGLPSVKQDPNWIPVTEELPKKPGDYLVTITEKPFECSQRNFVCECHYCGNRLWNMPITFVVGEREITAWQPLPKPYELQESEEEE